jgi:hypothetical protein
VAHRITVWLIGAGRAVAIRRQLDPVLPAPRRAQPPVRAIEQPALPSTSECDP